MSNRGGEAVEGGRNATGVNLECGWRPPPPKGRVSKWVLF